MARPKTVPLLSAEWINLRVVHVIDQAVGIMEKMLKDMVSSGYLPLEGPMDANFAKRLTPEQRTQFGMMEEEI